MNSIAILALICCVAVGGVVVYQVYVPQVATVTLTTFRIVNLTQATLGYQTYHSWGIPDGAYYLAYENTHGDFFYVWLYKNNANIVDINPYGLMAHDFVNATGTWIGKIGSELFDPGNKFNVVSMIKTGLPQF